MASQPHSIFAASREAAQKIMDEGTRVLRYETTEDARIRSHLANLPRLSNGEGGYIYSHNEIDEILHHYHLVAKLRHDLRF